MTSTNNNIKEIFKKIKREDYIYLSVVIIFFITLIIVFSMAVNFISKNINKIFYSENNQEIRGLNIEQYTLIAKKLNLAIPDGNTQITVTQETTTATTTPDTIITPPLDKQSITIKILNGTTKKGLAAVLAKSITDEGFIVSKTGNEKSNYSTTTLIIQENKSDYTQILLDALHKSYPQAISTTTSKTSDTDVVIVIGNN